MCTRIIIPTPFHVGIVPTRRLLNYLLMRRPVQRRQLPSFFLSFPSLGPFSFARYAVASDYNMRGKDEIVEGASKEFERSLDYDYSPINLFPAKIVQDLSSTR